MNRQGLIPGRGKHAHMHATYIIITQIALMQLKYLIASVIIISAPSARSRKNSFLTNVRTFQCQNLSTVCAINVCFIFPHIHTRIYPVSAGSMCEVASHSKLAPPLMTVALGPNMLLGHCHYLCIIMLKELGHICLLYAFFTL